MISSEAAVARGWADRQEQPVDQNAPEADRRNVPDDVISVVRPPTEMIVAMKATATPAARVKAQTLNPLFRKCPTSNLCLSTPIFSCSRCVQGQGRRRPGRR